MEKYLDESGMEDNSVWATEAEIYEQNGNKHSWLPYTASLTLSVQTIG
jgi:hypothetical protein